MPKFQVSDQNSGKKYVITAPDQATAISAFQSFSGAKPAAQYPTNAQGQIDTGNPMAQGAPSAPDPNAPPIADQLSAGFTAGVNAIPIAGPTVLGGLERLKGMVQGRPYQDVAASDQAQVQQNPVAAGIGTVAGTVLPFMAGGAIPGVGRALGMTGNLASRMFFGGLSGAGISGADTIARGGTPEDAGKNALVGGALGGSLPVVGAGLRRLVSPFATTAAQHGAAQVMDREGVTLTAGQRTGSKGLRYVESELGGGAANAIQEQQGRQFTAAVLRRAGINADSAEPHVIDQGLTQLGNEFDRLAANNVMVPDAHLSRDLGAVVHDYNALVPESQRAPIINNVLGDIVNAVHGNGGHITGDAYQALRSRLDKASRAVIARDPHLSGALSDIRTALDANMERSIAAHNPGDLGAWREVRRNYRNMLVIEKAATGAGEGAAAGIISPAKLRSVAINQNRRAFARGRNDFTDLANAAVQTMTPLPQSGTAPRLAARAFGAIPAAIGAFAGSPAGFGGAALGAVAGAALPALAGRAALSGPGRAVLSNQLLAGPAGRALLAPAVPGLFNSQHRPVQITVRGGH